VAKVEGLDMLPGSSVYDTKNGTVVYSILFCQRCASIYRTAIVVPLPNLFNLLAGQFRCMNLLSSGVPTFLYAIVLVVSTIAKEKVLGVYTVGVIAVVKDIKTGGYWTVMEYPRVPMSLNVFFAYQQYSVATPNLPSCPYPTLTILRVNRTILIHTFPELFWFGWPRWQIGRAISTPSIVVHPTPTAGKPRLGAPTDRTLEVVDVGHDRTLLVFPKKRRGRLVGFQLFKCATLAA